MRQHLRRSVGLKNQTLGFFLLIEAKLLKELPSYLATVAGSAEAQSSR